MDVVIPYVDITEDFKSEYDKYIKKELNEKRFRSYGVLDCQVKLIRKYMPYINNIFIIVSDESQIPSDLDQSLCKIVYHKDIIPEKYLPCFNSCVIEMFVHKIHDLDEQFIYFNDDIFVIDYIDKKCFFQDGKPCLSFKTKLYDKNDNNALVYKTNLYNSTQLIAKLTKNENKFYKKYNEFIHCCRPYLKSTCAKVFNKLIFNILGTLTRTRHSKNLNMTLFNNYDCMFYNYKESLLRYTYIDTNKSIEEITNTIVKKENPIICINDNDDYYINFGEFKTELKNVLIANLENKKYLKPNKKINYVNFKTQDNIYVSFTSWKNRIFNCVHTVDLMLNQTLKPTKIILNLAEEEFPNKELDLPKELININSKLFEIYWVKENTNVWKKIIPTMNRFPNDLVLSIDDDIEYPSNYIEEMYKTYCENNKQFPVVAYDFLIDNELCHSGPFTLTSKKFYKDLLNKIYNELILPTLPSKKWQSDIVYYKVLHKLGTRYIRCNNIDGKLLYKSSSLNKENNYSNWTKEYKEDRNNNIKIIDKYLKNIVYKPEQIIVSLTSYPARIKYVKDVLESLINQNVPFNFYHIVLVLSKDEFPNLEFDLPDNLFDYINKYSDVIEILWDEDNIRSHKKLIPTLNKYPNNPILVCDDDVYRPNGWLKMFIEDHIKYPKDIIFGVSSWYFGDKYRLKRFTQFKCKKSGSINNLPEQIFKTAKPANGLGGCLYPIGTFKDERFFDRNKLMELSPTSDESWQYCFNIIENRTFRQTSQIIDYSEYFLDGTQEIETSLHKVNNYTKINETLFEAYPKFKSMLNKRMKEFIVSLTTHGERVKYINKTLNSLLKQSLLPYKIVLTLHEEDYNKLTEETLQLLNENKIFDLIICKEKLGPHTKYFYAMQKYRKYAVITVDDDHEYTEDLCESLWKSYIDNPNLISARRVHLIKRDENGKALSYNKWKYNCKIINNSNIDLFPTGVGGVLYPPDILKISDNNLNDIYNCLYADDIYLKWLEEKLGISTIWCKNNNTEGIRLTDKEIIDSALYLQNVKSEENRNDKYLKIFKL